MLSYKSIEYTVFQTKTKTLSNESILFLADILIIYIVSFLLGSQFLFILKNKPNNPFQFNSIQFNSIQTQKKKQNFVQVQTIETKRPKRILLAISV